MNPLKTIGSKIGDGIRNLLGLDNSAQAAASEKLSQTDKIMPAEVYAVKRKLGKSFFTRRLNPNTRRARIASLSDYEWAIAAEFGWIGRHTR